MITPYLRGLLGNQMFQYAICRIIADKNGYNFYIPREKNLMGVNISDYFDLDMGINDGPVKHNFTEDHTIQRFNPDIFNLSDSTTVSGFFQSEKYFVGYEDKIKEWFKLPITNEVQKFLDKYPINDYCYIHFRGGDYKDISEWFLPLDYYLSAIKQMQGIKDDMKFLIITDSVTDASVYFKEFDIISNDRMIDFNLLVKSKYCIIPNSTFSWWAAWLSDKKMTIAPSRWLNYNSPHLDTYPIDVESKKFTYI